ncbi:ATP-binding cassette domain-containing protein [Escherichia coli]|nr:ATP-binding cassette domain-containing protein [Escherichia coli]
MSTHEATSQQPLLQAIDLKKHYPVKKGMFAPERLVKALDGVSFNLERGKTLAVVGESGCGKSTLGRLLTMIEMPTGGELYYQGRICSSTIRRRRSCVGRKSRLSSRTLTVR